MGNSQQTMMVRGICNKFDVLQTVRSKRKDACFWNQEDNVELEENSQPPSSSPIPLQTFPQKHFKRSLSLTKVWSLSLKAWKIFTRLYFFQGKSELEEERKLSLNIILVAIKYPFSSKIFFYNFFLNFLFIFS